MLPKARKQARADPGALVFLNNVASANEEIYLSTVSVGEPRRGVELVRHRGDTHQARLHDAWLVRTLDGFVGKIVNFDAEAAQAWGRLRVPDPSHERDKQIAAIAVGNDLTVVSRNTPDYAGTGVRLVNPFMS
jgi:predicted nucleic acid-binding protein